MCASLKKIVSTPQIKNVADVISEKKMEITYIYIFPCTWLITKLWILSVSWGSDPRIMNLDTRRCLEASFTPRPLYHHKKGTRYILIVSANLRADLKI